MVSAPHLIAASGGSIICTSSTAGIKGLQFLAPYRLPAADLDDVRWLREQWDGPFMVKGITRVDDGRRVADTGATAISLSSHGGNDLDGTPATMRVLPAIAEAVGDQVEILLGGGIRRGGT